MLSIFNNVEAPAFSKRKRHLVQDFEGRFLVSKIEDKWLMKRQIPPKLKFAPRQHHGEARKLCRPRRGRRARSKHVRLARSASSGHCKSEKNCSRVNVLCQALIILVYLVDACVLRMGRTLPLPTSYLQLSSRCHGIEYQY